jgi:hypothetical protein
MVSAMEFKKIRQTLINRLPLGYYNGRLYRIVISAQGETKFELAAENFKPWVLIVSREFYQESLDQLALTNQREVKALLKLNNAHTQTDNVFCVNSITENQTFFNTWKFSQTLGSAFFTLPEGLLLVNSLQDNRTIVVETEQQQARLYVGASPQGLYSSKPTAVLNSVSRFCQSCGLPQQSSSSVLTVAQLPGALLKGLKHLSANQWFAFWRTPPNTFTYSNIKSPLLLGLSCILAYLTLSSGYIYWQNAQLEQLVNEGKADVTEAINVQDQLTALQLQVESLSAVTSEFTSKTAIWQILLPLYAEGKFSNVRYQDGRFILRGSTTKATELLAKLANHQGVLDAQFDLPVTSNRSQENFTISFRWQAPKQGIAKEKDDAVAA